MKNGYIEKHTIDFKQTDYEDNVVINTEEKEILICVSIRGIMSLVSQLDEKNKYELLRYLNNRCRVVI